MRSFAIEWRHAQMVLAPNLLAEVSASTTKNNLLIAETVIEYL
jgi:hypothetical protein